jgi:hypothetical protein
MSTRCAHQLCHCDVPAERLAQGAEHCSDSCAVFGASGPDNEKVCDCGHAPCAAAHASHRRDDEPVIALGAQYPEGGGS